MEMLQPEPLKELWYVKHQSWLIVLGCLSTGFAAGAFLGLPTEPTVILSLAIAAIFMFLTFSVIYLLSPGQGHGSRRNFFGIEVDDSFGTHGDSCGGSHGCGSGDGGGDGD